MLSSASSPSDSNPQTRLLKNPSFYPPDMKRIKHQNWSWLFVAGLSTALMAGCALGPGYKQPAVDVPENYRFATSQSADSLGDLPWWEVFKDPVLLDLITTAVTNNYDLQQAMARVEQARNVAIAARAPLFPQIGYGGNVGRG